MDIALCQLSKTYFYVLTRYNKILSHRNKLLKNSPSDEAIEIWDYQLAKEGAKIVRTRRAFISRLLPLAKEIHLDVAGEDLDIVYEGLDGTTTAECENVFLEALARSRERDKAFAVTHQGVHRDDIKISADGIDLRSFGSQGQQRSAALSLKLAEMEKAGKLTAVITQNIDGLHQAAGSKTVMELHGSVLRNYCEDCNKFFDVSYVKNSKGVPVCDKCGGRVKPDVVLYEENLNMDILEASVNYISQADMLIIGGTSLVVYPAAGLIRYYRGNKLVLVNKSETSADRGANLVIHDSIGKVFSQIVL